MEQYMICAYKEALKSFKINEVPVGAVIVMNGKIIAKAHNNRQKKHNVLGHAEILAILKASKKVKDWRLDNCELYVTLEPCDMCTMVINKSRIKQVYYLLSQPNGISNNVNTKQTNVCNELKEKYLKLLNDFFSNLRK